NPVVDRIARQADRQITIDEGPVPIIEYGRRAIAEVGGDCGGHQLAERPALDDRLPGAKPCGARAWLVEASLDDADLDQAEERILVLLDLGATAGLRPGQGYGFVDDAFR